MQQPNYRVAQAILGRHRTSNFTSPHMGSRISRTKHGGDGFGVHLPRGTPAMDPSIADDKMNGIASTWTTGYMSTSRTSASPRTLPRSFTRRRAEADQYRFWSTTHETQHADSDPRSRRIFVILHDHARVLGFWWLRRPHSHITRAHTGIVPCAGVPSV